MAEFVATVAAAIWAMLPAYVPNNVAVLAGGGRPIDGGRSWHGRRLLGDGKTWRGTAAGLLVGVALAFGLDAVHPAVVDATGLPLSGFVPTAAVTLPAGAMLGDVAASFLKRRTGRQRGAAWPVVDQLDFVAGALGLTAVFATEWFLAVFTLPVLAAVVVVTPLLHLATNLLAYVFGLKSEPW